MLKKTFLSDFIKILKLLEIRVKKLVKIFQIKDLKVRNLIKY